MREQKKCNSLTHPKRFIPCFLALALSIFTTLPFCRSFDYGDALSKSLLYFEAQRSGHLPYGQRVRWRHHSGLNDGLEQGVDLVGGYYDAGDNVKFGLPMAYTITLLSWSVVEYGDEIAAAGEFDHALQAIKWGTDYFIKAHPHPHVGDGETDHLCWQRPEDMTTSRRAYKVDEENPGSEVAAETAAAMAAASIVFREVNPHYSHLLLEHAMQLFEFGEKFRGKYDESIEVVKGYYPSASGYKDELLWAALWLYKATDNLTYFNFAIQNGESFGGTTWAITEFSWDVKYAGLQLIAAMLPEEGKTEEEKQTLQQYRSKAEFYICACLNMNNSTNVKRTPAGLLYTRRWNNLQYVSNGMLLLTAYSDHLRLTNQMLNCDTGSVRPHEILLFVKSQIDYILGANPMGVSYLVGYGPSYPMRVHHRGASTIAYRDSKVFVGCMQGYHSWLGRQASNPNVLVGALVGGPDLKDGFRDRRTNFAQLEACTYNTASLVGVFAKFNALEKDSSSPSDAPDIELKHV
ncbi:glycosyl hydrolase 9B8 [Perilla frutescens var. hirtella]|nr:glycosyl hydrolase 9B8 [Perilla frutescens var. frutescens]KAH6775778.1 glycosyl hydrolase 9B8 [Perilla frutescens var. hirtella]